MTWSSALTSRDGVGGRPRQGARAAWFLFVGLALAGCQSAKVPPPPVPAYADLGVLVRRHPGWRSVAQYDVMLARLQAAIRQGRTGSAVPDPSLTLPAQSGLNLPGEAYTMPAEVLAQEQRQLEQQTQTQLARLRARLALAGRQQLELQQPRWQRDAELQYARAAQAAQALYTQRYDAAFAAGDVRRVNLRLQIDALEKTVTNWKLSKPPPTPLLDRAINDLADKKAERDRLDAQHSGIATKLLSERAATLAQAAADRDASVRTQRDQLAQTLRTRQEVRLAAQRRQLERQTALLLRQERALAAGTVRAVGSVGTLSLPPSAAQATKPVRDLKAAARQLQLQRDRWIVFLYHDTQAAAQDAARQRGWIVTFDSSHRRETDVTVQLATLLTKGVWKA